MTTTAPRLILTKGEKYVVGVEQDDQYIISRNVVYLGNYAGKHLFFNEKNEEYSVLDSLCTIREGDVITHGECEFPAFLILKKDANKIGGIEKVIDLINIENRFYQ